MRVPTYDEAGRVNGVVTIDEVIDDSIEVGPLVGLGRDNADKGTNKGLTQVYKYALIQTLCIGDSKDDGDSQAGAEADARGGDESADRMWGGWAHEEEQREAVEAFRTGLKEGVDAGRMTNDAATEAWKAYRFPDGPDRPSKQRTKAQHQEIWAATFPPAAEPDTAGPPEAPETAPQAETPQPSPPAEKAPEPPAQPPAATDPPGFPEVPPDNGYRGDLDRVFNETGIDGVIEALKKQNVEAVVGELKARGVEVEGSMKVAQTRQLLAAIILKRGQGDAAVDEFDRLTAPPEKTPKPSGQAGGGAG